MNLSDLDFLKSAKAAADIRKHVNEPPERLAQKGGDFLPGRLLAEQVKARRKAAQKLPSWVDADCIFHPLGLEQATSEALAAVKPWGKGVKAWDLTCGMGVDAAAIAKHYEQVIAIEIDPVRAELARINFERLGIRNVKVVEMHAEHMVSLASPGMPVDLIYADPARRDKQGGRTFAFYDCEPDIHKILPYLQTLRWERILLKGAPMFDPFAASQEFDGLSVIRCLSQGNELKELLLEWNRQEAPLRFEAISLFREGLETVSGQPGEVRTGTDWQMGSGWLYEPDVAVRRLQLEAEWAKAFTEGVFTDSATRYLHCKEQPKRLNGRCWRIRWAEPYKPKTLRKRLQTENIRSAQVITRACSFKSAEIQARLGLREGDEATLIFIPDGRGAWCVCGERETKNVVRA